MENNNTPAPQKKKRIRNRGQGLAEGTHAWKRWQFARLVLEEEAAPTAQTYKDLEFQQTVAAAYKDSGAAAFVDSCEKEVHDPVFRFIRAGEPGTCQCFLQARDKLRVYHLNVEADADLWDLFACPSPVVLLAHLGRNKRKRSGAAATAGATTDLCWGSNGLMGTKDRPFTPCSLPRGSWPILLSELLPQAKKATPDERTVNQAYERRLEDLFLARDKAQREGAVLDMQMTAGAAPYSIASSLAEAADSGATSSSSSRPLIDLVNPSVSSSSSSSSPSSPSRHDTEPLDVEEEEERPTKRLRVVEKDSVPPFSIAPLSSVFDPMVGVEETAVIETPPAPNAYFETMLASLDDVVLPTTNESSGTLPTELVSTPSPVVADAAVAPRWVLDTALAPASFAERLSRLRGDPHTPTTQSYLVQSEGFRVTILNRHESEEPCFDYLAHLSEPALEVLAEHLMRVPLGPQHSLFLNAHQLAQPSRDRWLRALLTMDAREEDENVMAIHHRDLPLDSILGLRLTPGKGGFLLWAPEGFLVEVFLRQGYAALPSSGHVTIRTVVAHQHLADGGLCFDRAALVWVTYDSLVSEKGGAEQERANPPCLFFAPVPGREESALLSVFGLWREDSVGSVSSPLLLDRGHVSDTHPRHFGPWSERLQLARLALAPPLPPPVTVTPAAVVEAEQAPKHANTSESERGRRTVLVSRANAQQRTASISLDACFEHRGLEKQVAGLGSSGLSLLFQPVAPSIDPKQVLRWRWRPEVSESSFDFEFLADSLARSLGPVHFFLRVSDTPELAKARWAVVVFGGGVDYRRHLAFSFDLSSCVLPRLKRSTASLTSSVGSLGSPVAVSSVDSLTTSQEPVLQAVALPKPVPALPMMKPFEAPTVEDQQVYERYCDDRSQYMVLVRRLFQGETLVEEQVPADFGERTMRLFESAQKLFGRSVPYFQAKKPIEITHYTNSLGQRVGFASPSSPLAHSTGNLVSPQ